MRTEKHLLVAFIIPAGDLDYLNTAEMNLRGIPTNHRPTRSPGRAAKMILAKSPFSEGPLQGMSLKGGTKFGGYYLSAPGGQKIADVKANGVFEIAWVPGCEIPGGGAWLQNLVAETRDNVDREGVRRIFLAWLLDIGFEDTGVPGLYAADLSVRPALETVIDALPEAFWTVWEAAEV